RRSQGRPRISRRALCRHGRPAESARAACSADEAVPAGLRGARGSGKAARDQGGEGQLMPRAVEGGLRDAGLLAGRLLLVFIFLHEGVSILGSYAGAAVYMQKSGVPSLLLPAVIALQVGGGALIAAGVMTRFAALP